jgi:hypothetical protein
MIPGPFPKPALQESVRTLANELKCDENDLHPCGTRDNDPDPDNYCNPCRVRRDLLALVGEA